DDLVAADVGDAGQVVVLVPPGLAERAEVANVAVCDGPGLSRPGVADGVEEALANAPERAGGYIVSPPILGGE
ncbi:MAG TPA: hypothetical protein VGJ71_09150, partial [Candidatus Limnocylindrales bacterium]